MFTKTKNRLSAILLIIVYLVGVIGITIPLHPDFVLLTPLNLLFSMAILLWTDESDRRVLFPLLLVVFLWGFFIEVAGVNTGMIFGQYSYGKVLGFKLWETPLLIGVNWAMLIYASSSLVNFILVKKPTWLKTVFVAALMTGLDVLIEPVAIALDFWTWTTEAVPLQNYIAWFLVSLPAAFLFQLKLPELKNKVAVVLFILQVLFFCILGVGIGDLWIGD